MKSMTKLGRIGIAFWVGYLMSLALSYVAKAAPYTVASQDNAVIREKLSIGILSQTYRQCVSHWHKKGELYSQAVARCSCEGDYASEHVRISMTESQQLQIGKEGKKFCDRWLSKEIITEN